MNSNIPDASEHIKKFMSWGLSFEQAIAHWESIMGALSEDMKAFIRREVEFNEAKG